jgi:succinate dehydrogenase / fumarate reductase membrane anchor subunit
MKASSHWFFQRVSAIMLCVLVPSMWWFVDAVKYYSYTELMHAIKTPFSLFVVTVICLVALYHARLGMQVVIDDYSRGIRRRVFQLCTDSVLLLMALGLFFSGIILLKGI